MKRKYLRDLWMAGCLLLLFIIWTILVQTVDVKPIGPRNSAVGFASINGLFHSLTGTHMQLYTITDWLGLVPLGICVGFGILGFVQMVQRKRILKVDADILALGVFYVVVIVFYLLFEAIAINFRPVLINGFLESSYPSSTTLLALCVMPTTVFQMQHRMKRSGWRRTICALAWVFTGFMVIGRLVSGVHWLTDIIGSVLLSSGLVLLYNASVVFSGKSSIMGQ